MLETLFTSKARVEILKLLLLNPENQFYLREISTLTHQPPRAVQREIKRLKHIMLIGERKEGNRKYYQINREHPIFPDLKSLFIKTVGLGDMIRQYLQDGRSEIVLAFIFGSYAKGTEKALSDIDLMVIGDISGRQLSRLLSPSKEYLRREINFVNMNPQEFELKVKEANQFIQAVLQEPKIFLIGGEDELRSITKH